MARAVASEAEGDASLEYLAALTRAVPQHIARAVLGDPSERSVRHASLDGTVLYADLVGFTALCEQLAEGGTEGLSRLSSLLDRLLAALVDEAMAPYGGSVAQFGGDSVTAFFDGDRHADRAAAAALTAQRIMHGEVGRMEVKSGNLALRIGLASGRIDLPVLGDLTRRVVVCSGRAAHRALELQAYATPGSVTLDASTIELLGRNAELVERKPDAATLRGLRVLPPGLPPQPIDLGDLAGASQKVRLLEPFVPQPLARRLQTTPEGWRIEGELRHVTVVFSEITGLGDRSLSIHAIEQLSRSILRAYRRHSGVVAKADITPTGHRMMVLFGLHEPSENDAERALLAALEATSRVRLLTGGAGDQGATVAEPIPSNVQMRTGVHGGRVFFGAIGSDEKHDITVVGDAVNVAARCCGLAGPFEVLASAAVAKAIGSELRVTEREATLVKGKREPLRTVVVHGLAEGHTHLARRRSRERYLAGRSAEKARLSAIVDEAFTGKGFVVGISGEAGLGKSALLGGVIDKWLQRGGSAVVGRCRYATRAMPLAPVTRIFESTLGLTQIQSESERREKIRATLAAFGLDGRAPELVALLQPVQKADGTTEAVVDLADPHAQERVITSIVQFIAQRVRREPLLYVVEDVHYADTLTLRLMSRLSTLGRDWPFLCVGTYRPDPLLDDLRRTADTEVALKPLVMADIVDLVRHERNADRVEPDLAMFVWQRSSGNPRHAVELVRFLSERELLTSNAGTVTAHPSIEALNDLVPQSLAHVALARFSSLAETTRRVLRLASALGRRFDKSLLTAIAHPNLDADGVDAGIASLESERLIIPDGDFSYVFRDDLTRVVAYTTIPEGERRKLHKTVADAVSRLPPMNDARSDVVLAHHRERAGQLVQAAAHYEAAARQAEAASMNRECVQFVEAWNRVTAGLREHERPVEATLARMGLLRLVANARMGHVRKSRRAARALAVVGARKLQPSERILLAYWLGETARLYGKPNRAKRELQHVARNAPDKHLRADAAHALAIMAMYAHDIRLAVRWVEAALGDAEDDSYRLARIALTHASIWSVRGVPAKAAEIYERVRNSTTHREHLHLRGLACLGASRLAASQGEGKRAVELATMALRMARGAGRPTLEANALLGLGTAQLTNGETEAAHTTLERAKQLARELGDATTYGPALVHFGGCIARQGDLVEGMRLIVDGEQRCIKAELTDGVLAARAYLAELSSRGA